MGLKIAIVCGTLLLQLQSFAQNELPVADNHIHIRSQQAADTWQQIHRVNPALANSGVEQSILARDIIVDLNLAGIEQALLISEAHIFSMLELNPSAEYSLVMAENDFVAGQVATSPTRLAGLCALDPLADYALEEVQRCAQELELAGVSLHFNDSNIDLRSNDHLVKLAEFFEFIKVLEYPVLIHLATRNPYYGSVDVKLFIDNVLINAPSIDIQIAHFGGHERFNVQSDRAMSEFIAAFSDGRLQPSRVQFDLAEVPPASQTQAAAQNQTRQKTLAAMYTQRIQQLEPQQILFASAWTEQSGSGSRQAITDIKNSLSLGPRTITSFFTTKSRFFDN